MCHKYQFVSYVIALLIFMGCSYLKLLLLAVKFPIYLPPYYSQIEVQHQLFFPELCFCFTVYNRWDNPSFLFILTGYLTPFNYLYLFRTYFFFFYCHRHERTSTLFLLPRKICLLPSFCSPFSSKSIYFEKHFLYLHYII